MRITALFIGLLALSINVLATVEVEEGVLVLNAENFDSVVNSELTLVEFYAPWCGHCKTLAPKYAAAAAELEPLGVKLAKINADSDENRPIASRFDVKGFPTMKVFRGGNPSDYEGGRETADIVSYMKRQAAPANINVNSTEQLKSLIESGSVVIVGFFAEKDTDEHKKFETVASVLRNSYTFASVVGLPSLSSEHGAEGPHTVIVFKPFDEKKNVLTATEVESLEASVKKYAIPLVDEIGPENYKTYVGSGLPLAYLFLKPEQKDTELPKVREIADATRGKLNWVWIDGPKYNKHGENLGLSGKTFPAFVIEEFGTGLHFVFDETAAIETAAVKDFVTKYLAKELQPFVKSEEIPESNDAPVKIVVGKNFDDIVKDSSKHVLLEFYAPWCGHCKTLAPVWEELGLQYQSSSDVVIAKIDATANDVSPSLGIKGFPTIKLFTKGDKATPIDYEGNRSKEDLVSFISKHTGTAAAAADADDSKDEL